MSWLALLPFVWPYKPARSDRYLAWCDYLPVAAATVRLKRLGVTVLLLLALVAAMSSGDWVWPVIFAVTAPLVVLAQSGYHVWAHARIFRTIDAKFAEIDDQRRPIAVYGIPRKPPSFSQP